MLPPVTCELPDREQSHHMAAEGGSRPPGSCTGPGSRLLGPLRFQTARPCWHHGTRAPPLPRRPPPPPPPPRPCTLHCPRDKGYLPVGNPGESGPLCLPLAAAPCLSLTALALPCVHAGSSLLRALEIRVIAREPRRPGPFGPASLRPSSQRPSVAARQPELQLLACHMALKRLEVGRARGQWPGAPPSRLTAISI